jgi:hypothetical protein
MDECNPVNTPVESEMKLSRYDEGMTVDATLYRSLVGNLRYLTCTRSDIAYGVGLVRRYMENHYRHNSSTSSRSCSGCKPEIIKFKRGC